MGDIARILIVDDDENIRKVLTAILEGEGYSIRHRKECNRKDEKKLL